MIKKLVALLLLGVFVIQTTAYSNTINERNAEITLSSYKINFGEVFLGESRIDRVILINTGNDELVLGPVLSSSNDFTVYYSGGNSN